ncbi:hypothetical protein ACJRO7_009265 [Eucalyptus globulus]|uniref:Uncharacterized protein n=1 Tax=Eucalyptus globulus TaxID=34317 RepID=A0ABD3LDU3_EUCGL
MMTEQRQLSWIYLQSKGQLPQFCASRVNPSNSFSWSPARTDPPHPSLTRIYHVQTLSSLTSGPRNQCSRCSSGGGARNCIFNTVALPGPCYTLSSMASELLLQESVQLSRDLQHAGARFSVGAFIPYLAILERVAAAKALSSTLLT